MPRLLAPSFFGLALFGSLAVALRPASGEAATIVLPPWIASPAGIELVAGAGGRLLSVTAGGRLIRATFETDDFLGRLWGRGITLVVRARSAPCSSGGPA